MAEMQLKVLEILQPEIQKLKNFMAFQARFLLIRCYYYSYCFCSLMQYGWHFSYRFESVTFINLFFSRLFCLFYSPEINVDVWLVMLKQHVFVDRNILVKFIFLLPWTQHTLLALFNCSAASLCS